MEITEMATVPETHKSLLTYGQIATLSTIGADGFPQATVVSYALDADGVVGVSLNRARQKTKNLIANPKAALTFVDPANQYRYLEIRSIVEILDDPDYAYAGLVNAKYGADPRDNDQPGETRVWVRFPPARVNSLG
jgi:PPOX class probable F420-dependent enzyme